ncbi:hypothetical protein F3Y22_tig00109921pilonHSYRG00021 [Hibiscus syriacus]|uniref:ABC transmembrane type-1 domain-containing protein n=1 Tax=Hibiscus syriacus TaxID=106335 RepID=A0A6A3BVX6_HIBSY|nr:hypothetical protein F3Y22_tig00109921pilonHSYRG00021 [Hibiscus syriacus]
MQLTRAVYNDADIYLLDDPFSAVDALTASVLFNDCVMTALEKKTVILITHQVEFLSEVDRILVIDGGQIIQSGSYKELLMAGTAFEQLVNAHRYSITASGSRNGEGRGESQRIAPKMSNVSYPTKQNLHGLCFDLKRICLSILMHVYSVDICQAVSTYWLALAIQIPNMTNSMLIGVYTGIATLSAVFVYFRSHYAAHLGLKASKAFFSGLTNAIFKAAMLFFDSTPVGRILTRVSSDMSVLDFNIHIGIEFAAAGATEVMATIGLRSDSILIEPSLISTIYFQSLLFYFLLI